MLKFHRIEVSYNELSLENVLQVGQAFRWVYNEIENYYMTSMKLPGKIEYDVVVLRQHNDQYIEFALLNARCDREDMKAHLERYFRLEVNLTDLHEKVWIPSDPNFKKTNPSGTRILAQEPWETLVSFICSTNNNISRITQMCHNLCKNYGNRIGTLDGIEFYSFPTSNELVNFASEAQLRELGFGYRAKYIMETAKKMVTDKQAKSFSHDWEFLEDLRKKKTYEEIREHLMSYTGVGPKVADCACLMGLHIDSVVPVDVHVSRIAVRDYKINSSKSDISKLRIMYNHLPITKRKINLELDYIRIKLLEKWGSHAGWAQGILFLKEIGGSSGSTTTGKIKKRKIDLLEQDFTDTTIVKKIVKIEKTEG